MGWGGVEEDLNERFAGQPSSDERAVEMSRLVVANIEEAGHADWPPIDDPCHAKFLNAPVDKGSGSKRRRAAPAAGTVRSRKAGLRRTYEAAERCGATIPELTHEDDARDAPDIKAALADWQPRSGFEDDLELLDAVRPSVQEWVVAAAPKDDDDARQLMRKVALLTVWDLRKTGRATDKGVLTETNTKQWLKDLAKPPSDRSGGRSASPPSAPWCRSTLSLVRRVGHVVNPAG